MTSLETMLRRICMIWDTDVAVDQLQQAIISSYNSNCPARTNHSPRNSPWWNRKMSVLRVKTRRLLSWQNRWLTGLALLCCQMVHTLKLDGKLWETCSESTFPTEGFMMIKMMGRDSRTWKYCAVWRSRTNRGDWNLAMNVVSLKLDGQ